MAATIITPEDLEKFRLDLLNQIKELLYQKTGNSSPVQEEKKWIKSHEVQRQLGISPGTLQTLRINGTIPYTKLGGVIYYDKQNIESILENNMRNKF